jgi:hypothetical protein
MSDENTIDTPVISQDRVVVKILKPFMYNGSFVREGDEVEMNEARAVNHMRVGDVERNEDLIKKIKEQRTSAAQAAIADAEGDW